MLTRSVYNYAIKEHSNEIFTSVSSGHLGLFLGVGKFIFLFSLKFKGILAVLS